MNSKNEYLSISSSIHNIEKLQESNICDKCKYYIPINDDRIPPHFCCQRFYELIQLPKAINEIYIRFDEEYNMSCMSFIEKE